MPFCAGFGSLRQKRMSGMRFQQELVLLFFVLESFKLWCTILLELDLQELRRALSLDFSDLSVLQLHSVISLAECTADWATKSRLEIILSGTKELSTTREKLAAATKASRYVLDALRGGKKLSVK